MRVCFIICTDSAYLLTTSGRSVRRSVRGDKFVGCAFDEDNQPELSEERAKNWVTQIKGEGITI